MEIPEWELRVKFAPEIAVKGGERRVRWRQSVEGEIQSAETVMGSTGGGISVDALPLRDDTFFVPGQLRPCLAQWEMITRDYPLREEVMRWVTEGVSICDYFQPFRGRFKGKDYDSAMPPNICLPNARNCEPFAEFIAATLEERVRSGAVALVGRVGECVPPKMVMPITMEEMKPRCKCLIFHVPRRGVGSAYTICIRGRAFVLDLV